MLLAHVGINMMHAVRLINRESKLKVKKTTSKRFHRTHDAVVIYSPRIQDDSEEVSRRFTSS